MWLKCGNCGLRITRCDNCYRSFYPGKRIICFGIGAGDYHFCSVRCMREFLEDNTYMTVAIKNRVGLFD